MSHRVVAGLIVALVTGSGQPTEAQPAPVEVSLVSVSPGTPAGVSDWCVGVGDQVVVTAHVVAAQAEVTAGTVTWQVCENRGGVPGALPKEECQRGGSGRWVPAIISDLSFDSTPSLATNFQIPTIGFRLQFSPGSRSGLKRATSEPFNLDRTCSP
jgi:hypothetical protein